MKDIKSLEYFMAKDVTNLLKISAPTLRKYCVLITKEYGKEYFKRDDSNARLYTDDDIKLIKRVISLKKAPHITLENAVRIALNEVVKEDKQATVSVHDTSDRITENDDMRLIQNYDIIINKQSDHISQLTAVVNDLMASNVKLSEQVETLLNKLETAHDDAVIESDTNQTKDKGNWLSRLFGKGKK